MASPRWQVVGCVGPQKMINGILWCVYKLSNFVVVGIQLLLCIPIILVIFTKSTEKTGFLVGQKRHKVVHQVKHCQRQPWIIPSPKSPKMKVESPDFPIKIFVGVQITIILSLWRQYRVKNKVQGLFRLTAGLSII